MLIRLFILFVCYSPIVGLIFPRISGIDIRSTWLLFYLLIFVFMIYCFAIRPNFKFLNAWTLILGFYFLVVVVSVTWSNYSYDIPTLKRLFVKVFAPITIATMALYLFEDTDNVRLYIKHIIFASFILSLISICQMFFGVATPDEELRSAATLGNPNGLAIFLVLAFPCLIYATEKSIVPKVFGWIAIACMIGGIVCTVSRKGIVTLVIASLLYYTLKRHFKRVLLLGIVFAFLAVTFSGYAVISHRFTPEKLQHQFEGKANMAYAGWRMFKRSPIIGLGYQGYYENFGKYFPYSRTKKYDAHNIYITALANYGLFGFIPFMGIFIYPLVVSARILRQNSTMVNNEYSKDMAVICISCVLPFMISGYYAGGLFYSTALVSLLYTHTTLGLSSCIGHKESKMARDLSK